MSCNVHDRRHTWRRPHGPLDGLVARQADAYRARFGRHTSHKEGNPMHHPYCLPLWCATILLGVAATGVRAQVDPKALLQKQFETLARGDVAGALALYTEDAVVDGAGLCVAAPCVGKAAIQKEFEHLITNKVRASALNYYVSG